jgi:hypothetical protein
MSFKLTYENMLYLALGLVILFIIYKLFNMYRKDDKHDINYNMEEGFQSIINKFKNTSSKIKLNKPSKPSKIGKTSKLSFDDIIAEAEDMDPSKYTVDNIKNDFFRYLESFNKAKFKNVSGTTDEALEKFGFFKDKFFEIFM